MLPRTTSKKKKSQVGDLQIKGRSTTKQYFDGQRWRDSCTVYNCNRPSRVKGLCVQHLKELGESQRPSTDSSMDDIFTTESNLKKRKYLEEEDDDFINHAEENTMSSFNDIPSTTDQTSVSRSSITILATDTSSKTLPTDSINQHHLTPIHTCRYQLPSTDIFHCRSQGTYQCPHCEISFCLQHGLKHQEDLKIEISSLLTKSQEFFDNVQKLNLIDVKTSCTTKLDEWARTMHSKIDQIRDDLQITLEHFEKSVQEKSDQLKTYLASHLEQNVGCILTEQLQQFEIDKPQMEKVTREYNRLENIFHLFNNQQLITMMIDTENQVNLNPPVIICSDIVMDGFNLMENVQEKMDNALSNKLNDETGSFPDLNTDEIKDNPDVIIISGTEETDTTTDNNRKDTAIELIENFPTDGADFFQDLFNENMFDAAVDFILREEIVTSANDSLETPPIKKVKPTTKPKSLPRHANISLEKISVDKRKGSNLDLCGQELGDQDMQVVIQYALENSKLTQPFKTLNLSSNQIGSRGIHYLCNALEKNTMLTKLTLDTNHSHNKGAQYLGDLLRKNSTLTELDISRNQIGFQGIISLSNALKENKTLTLLNLEHNLIGPKGAQYLSSAMQHNNTLQTLNLNWCCIDEIGAQYLSKTLKSNTSINTLELAGNQFGEAGALCFVHVLRQNSSLITLNFQSNQIGTTGAFYLSDGLRHNKTLSKLNLEQNQLRDTGIKHICDALRHNTTLTTLNLANNIVGKTGAQYIANLLSMNKTLTTLDLSSNEIQSAGSMYISDAICKNKTLISFNLQQNRIGQRGVQFLVDAMKENDTLVIFNVKGNNITSTDEAKLTDRLILNKNNQTRKKK